MKTFVRLIRRYVLAAVGIVLLLLFSGVAVLGWLGWQESCRLPQREYSSSEIADSMVETAEGLAFGAERTPQEWMNGYEWAMVLDDVGNIRWNYGLPQELNHAYTPGDIAQFARWYLADYPVFCWTEPYGLFVIGLPKGSLWKYSIYSSPDFALSMVRVLPAAALGLLLLGLALCFWLSWRGGKAAGDRGKRSGCTGAGADRPAVYRRFCRGTGRKAEPDRGAAASQKMRCFPGGTMPAPSGSQGSAMTCAPAGADLRLGGAAGTGCTFAGQLPAESDRHPHPVRKAAHPH